MNEKELKKDNSITFKTDKEFKDKLKKLGELETRTMSQTIEHYLKPVIEERIKELEGK